MANLATMQLIGNVGRDPESRYTPNGRQVVEFTMAVNKVQGSGAERKEETMWFRISCWGQLAQTAEQFVQKGRQVYVAGRFSARAYTGNDGQQRTSLEVTADQLVLIGSRQGEGGGGEEFDEAPAQAPQRRAPATPAPQRGAARARPASSDMNEDDIPF